MDCVLKMVKIVLKMMILQADAPPSPIYEEESTEAAAQASCSSIRSNRSSSAGRPGSALATFQASDAQPQPATGYFLHPGTNDRTWVARSDEPVLRNDASFAGTDKSSLTRSRQSLDVYGNPRPKTSSGAYSPANLCVTNPSAAFAPVFCESVY